MTVIILDQSHGPSPYQLQQQTMLFGDLLEAVRTNPAQFGTGWRAPEIRELDNATRFTPRFATIAYVADVDGHVAVWQTRLDSSG